MMPSLEATLAAENQRTIESDRGLPDTDYEELVDAALEDIARPGLKQRVRARFGPHSDGEGGAFDQARQRSLVRRVMETGGGDGAVLARKIRARFDAAGLQFPSVQVRFDNLTLSAMVPAGSKGGMFTVGVDFKVKLLKTLAAVMRKKVPMREVKLLHGVSGILRPGKITLLMGPPASGKSLLMKALCGAAPAVSSAGSVTYNGHTFNEFNVTRTAKYVSQINTHNPQLTVRETLAFSSKCQGAGYLRSLNKLLVEKEQKLGITPDPDLEKLMKHVSHRSSDTNIELILQLLSLTNCADTIVGDGLTRGISGGEKKRVTTGEMVVGPAKVLLLDEISTGLDSASTYTIVRSLANWAHATNATIIVLLLQPEPQTYDLFDDVMVLAEGRVIYHGDRTRVQPHFASLGFEVPTRKSEGDFLQEIVSPKDQAVLRTDKSRLRPDLAYVPPSAFADAFQQTPEYQDTLRELATPFDKARSHPAALMKSKFGVSSWDAFKALTWREIILLGRGRTLQKYRYMQMFVLSAVLSTLFLRGEVTNNKSFRGMANAQSVIFFSVTYQQFLGLADCAEQLGRLPLFYKQRANLFYPGWAFALPMLLVKLPIMLLEVTYWSIVVYWIVGLEASAGRFFCFWGTLLLLQIYSTSLYRLIGSSIRSMVTGATFAVFVMFLTLLGSGFVLPKPSMPDWFAWFYWVSPLQYALTGLVNNEFLGDSYSAPYPLNPSITQGEALMQQTGVPIGNWHRWAGPLVLIGWAVGCNILHMFVLTVLPPPAGPPPAPPPTTQEIPISTGQKEATTAVKNELYLPEPPSPTRNVHGSSVNVSADGAVHAAPAVPAALKVGSGSGSAQQSMGSDSVTVDVKARAADGSMLTMAFEPLTLAFSDVHYYVPNPKGEGELELLKGVTGVFSPGVMTALMGSSGAGKSTLMDVLTDRKTVGRITGKITVNGFDKNPSTFARVSGYCEQFDTHSAGTSVEEAVRFSAALRLSKDTSPEQREMFVRQTMDIVELKPIANSIVGIPGMYGLSNEQFKRLTIAVELVANPSIMFMDEPTSGLDARAAQIVMRVVRNIVNSNRTIVCTIHQPSAEIFDSFDEVLLLKRGGWTIYYGPLTTLVSYFESVPGVKKMPLQDNPATYMLEVSTAAEEERLGVNFADLYEQRLLPGAQARAAPHLAPAAGAVEAKYEGRFSTSRLVQYKALLDRCVKSYWRNPPYNSTRLILTVVAAILVGGVYFSLGDNYGTTADVTIVIGALFMSLLFLGSTNLQLVIPVFLFERPVLYREQAARMYSVFSWVSATEDVEIPWMTAQACMFTVICYPMVHFELEAGKFFFFLLVIWITLGIYTYLGMLLIAATPNHMMGVNLAAALQGVWIMFTGFLIPKPTMPDWWSWMWYLTPPQWAIYAVVASQLGDKGAGYPLATPEGTPTTISEYVATTYDIHYHLRWMAVGILFFMLVAIRLLLSLCIKFLNYQSR